MEKLALEYSDRQNLLTEEELQASISKNIGVLTEVVENMKLCHEGISTAVHGPDSDSLGWLNVNEWAGKEAVTRILAKADEVRKNADVFVLIGVGGSNQGARAVMKALQTDDNSPEILYAGNNLSANYMNHLIQKLEGKSVYINVIAKNFETLEPGIGFRVLRNYLSKKYGADANKRIAVTGTRDSLLHQVAKVHGYDFFTFPDNIGGRYSVLSDVGLFPMAVAGIDLPLLIKGAEEMQVQLSKEAYRENRALIYATARNLLLQKGYKLEMLAFFEPQLHYFSKWWIQLFAESEGKEGKGLYPVAANYSEDLHSVGQYVQEGQPMIFETFLDVLEQNSTVILVKDDVDDRFDYLNNKNLWEINKAAFEATINAHRDGGVPCFKLSVPKINEYYFGQLFYFFEFSCYLSGKILGINPFDQPGVEGYKRLMFHKLGKDC